MKKVGLLYIPVIHRGYQLFLDEILTEGATDILLISSSYAQKWAPTHKDIHALSDVDIEKSLRALFPEIQVHVIERTRQLSEFLKDELSRIKKTDSLDLDLKNQDQQSVLKPRLVLVCPREMVTREVTDQLSQETWFKDAREKNELLIDERPVFLRWEKKKALASNPPQTDAQISSNDSQWQSLFEIAHQEGELSADWWRQVGAVLVKDGQILLQAHNLHLPHEQQPNVEGDIRAQFHQGDHWELGTAIHAEAEVIAQAAKKGLSVAGTDLIVTDFPCPNCAKLIARSGIRRVFFVKGYAVSDGERILRSAEVELVQIIDEERQSDN